MNIVIGINPKTNKKETYQFADTDKGFEEAQDKLSQLDKLKYKKTGHEWKATKILNNIKVGVSAMSCKAMIINVIKDY